jgi:hypothetical protein
MRQESIKAFFLKCLRLVRQADWFKQRRMQSHMITNLNNPPLAHFCPDRLIGPHTLPSVLLRFLISITLPIGAFFRRGAKRPRISELKGRQEFGAQTLLRKHWEARSEVGAAAIECDEFIVELKDVEKVTEGSNSLSGSYFGRRGFGALQMHETFGALLNPYLEDSYGALQIVWN